MLDKLPLDDEQISACVRATYGLTVTDITFLPLGHDSKAGVYRVQAGSQTYFLKIKGDAVSELSVRLPQYLKAQGMNVVAPLPTLTGALWGKINSFTLLLYPFIDGPNGWDVDLSASQWIAYGATLRQLHATQLPPDLLRQMPRETFTPHAKWMQVLRQLQAAVPHSTYDHPAAQQLATFWREHRHDIGTIIERTEQLSAQLSRTAHNGVLCHADIHAGNLLLDAQGTLFIVDWDQPILAPRERDLMFVTVGGFVTELHVADLILQGYGSAEINPLIMAYYRYERVMEDLADFADQVFLTDSSDETKQDAVYWFMRQFDPG